MYSDIYFQFKYQGENRDAKAVRLPWNNFYRFRYRVSFYNKSTESANEAFEVVFNHCDEFRNKVYGGAPITVNPLSEYQVDDKLIVDLPEAIMEHEREL